MGMNALFANAEAFVSHEFDTSCLDGVYEI